MKNPKRFEIWIVNWNPSKGSEGGLRPSLIIQTDAGNTNLNYPNTVVLAISSKGRDIPFHVKVEPSDTNGLKETSYIKCEQILTISKERLVEKVGILESEYMKMVEEAIKLVLGLR